MTWQKSLRVLDVRIDNLSRREAVSRAREFLRQPRFHHLVTPGPEFLLEATAHPRFQAILNRADLSIPDGVGLHLAARLTGQRLRQRITGIDFAEDLMRVAVKEDKSVFLFGGLPGAAERSAEQLRHRWPGLRIVGVESGYRGPWQKLHDQRVVERIHRVRPDIVLVALGAPKQELWIDRHRRSLHDVRLAIGVGRTLDYWAGLVKRPPRIISRSGLEWLYTFLAANKFYHGRLRRQRVRNATWHFVIEVWKRHHEYR
ncbi:MAG: WecB/TagA/CpsF family glycosyltransferase [Candidatus Kerfeldbacteria bacterium]|nr:WecB/TagA/CpsF family glycosyltransferase [Candidatus Kerfeldbacteria bacterium]